MASLKFQQNDMSKLEIQIMKIVTRNSGNTISETYIHNEISSKQDIKDPLDNEDLKKKIKIIITILPSLYEDDIKVKKIGNILYVSHCCNDSEDNLNGTYETVNQHDIEQSNPSTDKEDFYAVCKFIIDNNLVEYYAKENYDGTTILQALIEFCDEDRLNIMLYHLSPLQRNKNGIKPIDCIKDIKIAKIFIKQNMEDHIELENETIKLKKNVDHLKTIVSYQTIILSSIIIFISFFR
jgi:hypothetical protein